MAGASKQATRLARKRCCITGIVTFLLLGLTVMLLILLNVIPTRSQRDLASVVFRTKECSCGYRDNAGDIWMEKAEIDWSAINSFESQEFFRVSIQQGATVSDVVTKGGTVSPKFVRNRVSVGPAGLGLSVSTVTNSDQSIDSGQVESNKKNIRFGKFTAILKTVNIPGTCAGFFYYAPGPTNEIDLEILGSFAGNRDLSSVITGVQSGLPNQIANPNVWKVATQNTSSVFTCLLYTSDAPDDTVYV
jgi:hypothetical protein